MKLAVLIAAAGAALTLGAGPAGSASAPAAESCHANCFSRCQALYPNDPYLISSCTDGCVLTECGGEPWPRA